MYLPSALVILPLITKPSCFLHENVSVANATAIKNIRFTLTFLLVNNGHKNNNFGFIIRPACKVLEHTASFGFVFSDVLPEFTIFGA